MDLQEAIQVLEHHQYWWKGTNIPIGDVRKLTEALDIAIEKLKEIKQ